MIQQRNLLFAWACAAFLLAGCDPDPAPREAEQLPVPSGPPIAQAPPRQPQAPVARAGPAWESVASGEGTALRLIDPDGGLLLSIACLGGPPRLVATVPAFSPVGSEDRFALGLGDEPVTLVADPTRQGKAAGVTGTGPVPDDFEALLEAAKQVSANYGSQNAGPYPAPPPALADALAEACGDLPN